MKYDLFISYSRKDAKQVASLIDLLRREIPALRLWYDIDGIETADAFRMKIINAIDLSKAVLFVCSDNSLASEFCEKEVMYAKNTDKTVIPYLLKGVKLKGWLLFEFGNINCIHSTKADEVGRMIRDIRRWTLDEDNNKEESGSQGKDNKGKVNNDEVSQPSFQNHIKSTSLESQLEFDPVKGEFKQKTSKASKCKAQSKKKGADSHEYVDLGLPSGLKWATHNIGALKPEEYGDYFAWGDTKTKSVYSEGNCVTFNKDLQCLIDDGIVDINGNLTFQYDAARQNWGVNWRMPTRAEVEELIDNTTSEWGNLNGVYGRLIKSKVNRNSIFLPAAGWIFGTKLSSTGVFGSFWSSSFREDFPQEACDIEIGLKALVCGDSSRDGGLPIRPVME